MFNNKLNIWLRCIALLIAIFASKDASAQCTFSASVQGSGAGYTTIYRLTDGAGVVVDDAAPFTTPAASPTGIFRLYALTYDNAAVPAGIALAVGSNVSSVSGGCSDIDWIPAICRCESDAASVSVSVSGFDATKTQTYALMSGAVISTANTIGSFTAANLTAAGLVAGSQVRIYSINHDATANPAPASGAGLPTSGCYDADSYALVAAYSCCSPEAGAISVSPNPVCNNTAITVATAGNNVTTDYTTNYYIVNSANLVAFGPQASGAFAPLVAGVYQACVVNYKTTAGNPVTSGTSAPATGTNSTTPNCYEIACTNLTVIAPATAGTAVPPPGAAACSNSTGLVDLYAFLNGESAGGAWSVVGLPNPGANFVASSGILNPNGLAAGTYTFRYTVTGPTPCTLTDTEDVPVVITAAPAAGSPVANAGIGTGITLCSTAPTIDLFSYLTGEDLGGVWTAGTNPAGGTFTAAAGTFNPAGASGTYTFTYTVTVGSGVCAGEVDAETIIFTISPTVSAGVGGTTTRCNAGSGLVNLYGLLTGASTGGTWATSGAPVAPAANFFGIAGLLDPNGLAAGTYLFTYTVGAAPCVTDSETVSVTISDQPDAGIGSSTTVCNNSTAPISLAGLIAGEDAGGTWTAGANPVGGTFTAVSGTFVPTGANGVYTFVYTVAGTAPCTNDSETVTVIVNPIPSGTATPASAETCTGGTISVSLNANMPSTFAWAPASLPAGVTAPSGSGNTLNGVVTNSSSTPATVNYVVTVTSGFGCTSTFGVPVTINGQPVVTTTTTSVICRGDRTGTATANVIGGEAPYTYSWNTIPPFTTQTALGVYAGTYTVTVTDNNGCTNTASATVSQPAVGIDVNITQSAPIACFGGTTSLTASATGGTGAISYVWAPGGSTSTTITASAGNYTVTATDAVGCPDVATVTVAQPTIIACPFSINPASCGQANGSATVSPTGGSPAYTYSWSNGQTNATATGLAAGTYSVTVADSNNCNCVANGITVANQGSPTITGSSNVNEGTSGGTSPFAYNVHVFTVTGGTIPYNFNWNNSGYVRYDILYTATGATITVYYTDNASWNVTVSDSNGCTNASLEVHNTNNGGSTDPLLDITNYSVTGQSATGAPNGAINITVAGGSCNSNYTYLWSNGATTQDISGLTSGWYSVTVTCGTQTTQGWYWVPKARRGRNKAEGAIAELSVMPNPFANEATVVFTTPESGLTNLSVYSLDGKLVGSLFNAHADADATYSIPLSGADLPSGIYSVVLSTASGNLQYYKIVLTK